MQLSSPPLWLASGECPGTCAVPDTSMASAAHAVEQLARRPSNTLMAHCTDTHPANKEHFSEVLGPSIVGHRGGFHVTQKIMETTKGDHKHTEQAGRHLSGCLTCEDADDKTKVLEGLKHGTISRGPKTDDEIEEMI